MVISNSEQLAQQMREELRPEFDPGYLRYWKVRAENNADDQRSSDLVHNLTRVALRGYTGATEVEFIDHSERALKARYWYRSLGPLNPMAGIEPDLITASELMYGDSTIESGKNDPLRLDAAYVLSELARITNKPQTRIDALRLAVDRVRDIEASPRFAGLDPIYRLQTAILSRDLNHDILRLKHTGVLQPRRIGDDQKYREYEIDVLKQDLQSIDQFNAIVKAGATEENFGILFEWFYVLHARHAAWADHRLDKVSVRGATSRENAQWLGDWVNDTELVNANHDVVISEHKGVSGPVAKRVQLKTVLSMKRQYHYQISPVDFQTVFRQRFFTIDQATELLQRDLSTFKADYLN